VNHFCKDKENKKTLDRLFDAGLQIQSMKQEKKRKTLEGKTFVFTGELDNYTRSEAEQLVESLGGRATSSVSGNTDYVIVGENPGKKYDDAKENDVETLNEQEFEKMVK
jgi:DNA ligase (NAD+)